MQNYLHLHRGKQSDYAGLNVHINQHVCIISPFLTSKRNIPIVSVLQAFERKCTAAFTLSILPILYWSKFMPFLVNGSDKLLSPLLT